MEESNETTGVIVNIELITPDKAKMWLANLRNKNRNIRPGTVRRYATDMKEGRWMFNGESIVISETGRLINGFHRCSAIVQTGMPVHAVVVRGIPDEAYKTFDCGSTRTPTDTLGALGVKRPSRVANAIAKLIAIDRGKWSATAKGNCNLVTGGHYGNRNTIVVSVYQGDTEFFEDITQWGYNLATKKSSFISNLGLTKSDIIAIAAHLIKTQNQDEDKVKDFFYLLLGDNATATSNPSQYIDQLRDKLMAFRMDYNRNGRRTTPKIVQPTIAKAWLLFSGLMQPTEIGISLSENEKEYGLTFGGEIPRPSQQNQVKTA